MTTAASASYGDALIEASCSGPPSSAATNAPMEATATASTDAKRAARAGAASGRRRIYTPRAISAGRSGASTALSQLPGGPTSQISAALERRRYRVGSWSGASRRKAGPGMPCDVAAAGGNVMGKTAPEAHDPALSPKTVAAVAAED